MTSEPFDLSDPRNLEAAALHARRRTLALVEDLDDAQMVGPRLGTVNPLGWEIGHVAWFQERWTQRRSGRPSVRDFADAVFDSIEVPHALRWDLALPERAGIEGYMQAVLDAAVEQLRADPSPQDCFHQRYAIGHEDMHCEAITYTRQTHGHPAPPCEAIAPTEHGDWPGDVRVPAGEYRLGVPEGDGFAFDNEKGAHLVALPAFGIARAPVTQAEFAEFVDDAGYRKDALWSLAGRAWRALNGAEHPTYWRRRDGGWEARTFDRWEPLAPHRPIMHVSFYEAEAWCRWAGRRLPSEAEWEVAASWDPASQRTRTYPWGEAPPDSTLANLSGERPHCCDVAAFAAGDSPLGCRQMLGNVWEWTADWFMPYPGFVADPYREYSVPWFATHRTLRGGSLFAQGRLVRNVLRNYAVPTRSDLFSGFRTCSIDE